jgi:hypothetical protein
MMFGQDRYHRRYWVFPKCGGIFVEGLESGDPDLTDPDAPLLDVVPECAVVYSQSADDQSKIEKTETNGVGDQKPQNGGCFEPHADLKTNGMHTSVAENMEAVKTCVAKNTGSEAMPKNCLPINDCDQKLTSCVQEAKSDDGAKFASCSRMQQPDFNGRCSSQPFVKTEDRTASDVGKHADFKMDTSASGFSGLNAETVDSCSQEMKEISGGGGGSMASQPFIKTEPNSIETPLALKSDGLARAVAEGCNTSEQMSSFGDLGSQSVLNDLSMYDNHLGASTPMFRPLTVAGLHSVTSSCMSLSRLATPSSEIGTPRSRLDLSSAACTPMPSRTSTPSVLLTKAAVAESFRLAMLSAAGSMQLPLDLQSIPAPNIPPVPLRKRNAFVLIFCIFCCRFRSANRLVFFASGLVGNCAELVVDQS